MHELIHIIEHTLVDSLKLVDVVIEMVDARAPASTRNPDFDDIFGTKPYETLQDQLRHKASDLKGRHEQANFSIRQYISGILCDEDSLLVQDVQKAKDGQLPTPEVSALLEKLLLEDSEAQEEAAAAAAGICDGLAGLGAQALDHGLDEGPGGEVLTGTGLDILGVFLEQPLVDLALDIGGHGDPLFLVDHLHHPVEDGGVADLVGGLLEDLTQQTALLAQLFQGGLVLLLQLGSPEGIHILPAEALGDAGFFFIRGSGVLIGHFQKDEVSKLLQIISIGNTVIPEGIAQAPDLGDYR